MNAEKKKHNYKLTHDNVGEILLARAKGATIADLARRFGVTETTISRVLKRRD